MVAPPSFESPAVNLAALLQTGPPARSTSLRQTTPPNTDQPGPAAKPSTNQLQQSEPVRGARPVFPALSAPFVAQFIAQTLDPPASVQLSRADTNRAFDVFRQAQANAERLDDPAQ